MLVYQLFEADDEQPELQSPYSDEADIPEDAFPLVQAKIEALNKRADKLKVPRITLHVLDHFFKEVKADPHLDPELSALPARKKKYYKVKIEGETPKLAGWRFIATIEHKDAGNIVRAVPGEENNSKIREFYDADPDWCEYCKTRRHRIDTFIVQHENGEMKQIGRNCLTNFLGGMDPKAIIWYFKFRAGIGEIINDVEERLGARGGRRPEYYNVKAVLKHALAGAREHGYVTSKMAEDRGWTSTAMSVRNFFLAAQGIGKMDDYLKAFKAATPADEQMAEEMIAWFKALPEKERNANNFMHSLDVLLNSADVSGRDLGFVVALIPTYRRAMQMQHERKSKSNDWLGTAGQKLPQTHIKVVGVHDIAGQYGNAQKVSMEDESGNSIIWWNNSANSLDQGAEYNITGTIKKHDEYKGRKQTVLTRVKATRG